MGVEYKIPKKLPKAPKKTVKAYKLFTLGSDSKLYPLFVRANEPVSENEWIEAQMGEVTKEGKVKSKIGKLIAAAVRDYIKVAA